VVTAVDVTAAPTPLNVPGQRGRTTIADRVVARVATQAVAEVEGPARVFARVEAHLTMIEIRLSLAYPVPVRAVTREVRRHVIERVTGLTGLEVRHVDIEVAMLKGRKR
jgi:uncharacterized alkaline shock family protein YloU